MEEMIDLRTKKKRDSYNFKRFDDYCRELFVLSKSHRLILCEYSLDELISYMNSSCQEECIQSSILLSIYQILYIMQGIYSNLFYLSYNLASERLGDYPDYDYKRLKLSYKERQKLFKDYSDIEFTVRQQGIYVEENAVMSYYLGLLHRLRSNIENVRKLMNMMQEAVEEVMTYLGKEIEENPDE